MRERKVRVLEDDEEVYPRVGTLGVVLFMLVLVLLAT
jgi:hypothetical protein